MQGKIKPVLRYAGSKYRKLDQIFEILQLHNKKHFVDAFGGSGIVGVNAKSIYPHLSVTINDFDNVLIGGISKEEATNNMTSFDGNGKNFTESAKVYFQRRIENGYWDKLKVYNEILSRCHFTFIDWTQPINLEFSDPETTFYFDPPYDDIKGLYKKDFTKENHMHLAQYLNALKEKHKNILISYNDTPFIRELYKDWNIIEVDYSYTVGAPSKTKTKKKVQELFITPKR